MNTRITPQVNMAKQVGERIKINLHRAYQVGRIIKMMNGFYQIKAHTGIGLSCFPGGAGIVEMELELVKITNEFHTKKEVWEFELQFTGKTPDWHWTE